MCRQRGLFEVLKAYTQYKPNEGYCQAQGPVAAVLLMNMPAEVQEHTLLKHMLLDFGCHFVYNLNTCLWQEAFWCLVQISEQYLPGYYSPLLVRPQIE